MEWGARFEDALGYAVRAHRGQTRKGTEVPYVTHLLAVAAIVGEAGGDEDEAVAALLHDAVEDQGGTDRLADVRARYGERVAEIVATLTDAWVQPKPPWRERKEGWIGRLASSDPSAALVAAADKLHNARTMLADVRASGAAVWERFNAGRDDQLWYYRAVAEALRRAGAPAALVQELEETVAELARAG